MTSLLQRAALLVMLAWPWLSSVAASSSPDAAASPDEQEVLKLSAEEVQAFLRKDPATLARLWSEDFMVTNPLNKLVTKQQVLGMIQSGFLVITAFERKTEYTRPYGNAVFLAGTETVTWGGKMPNAGKTERLRFTAVWMKQDGRWQEVLRHANIVPEG